MQRHTRAAHGVAAPCRAAPRVPGPRAARPGRPVARRLQIDSAPTPFHGATHMPHILIVEDESSTSWALSEGLTGGRFTIDTFPNAEDAWKWLQDGRSDL